MKMLIRKVLIEALNIIVKDLSTSKAKEGDTMMIFGKPATFKNGKWVEDGGSGGSSKPKDPVLQDAVDAHWASQHTMEERKNYDKVQEAYRKQPADASLFDIPEGITDKEHNDWLKVGGSKTKYLNWLENKKENKT